MPVNICLHDSFFEITSSFCFNRVYTVGRWHGPADANGSQHEPVGLGGISHFLEHMVFKGTARRTSFEIASTFDRLGALVDEPKKLAAALTAFAQSYPDSPHAAAFRQRRQGLRRRRM